MTTAAIVIGILSAMAMGRVIFLNAEIKTLDAASLRFGGLIEGWRKLHPAGEPTPTNIFEAQTEYEWLVNARDSKKEARAVWFGGAVLLVVLLASALFEAVRN